MADKSRVLLAVQSPAPKIIAGSIVLRHQTWYGHVEPEHDVEIQAVNRTMSDPCFITKSITVPGDWVFVNEQDRNDWNEVLRVPVRMIGPATNIVTTAYHTDATFHGQVIWQRGDD